VNAYEVKAGTGVIADKTSMDNVSDIIFNIKNDKDAKVKIKRICYSAAYTSCNLWTSSTLLFCGKWQLIGRS